MLAASYYTVGSNRQATLTLNNKGPRPLESQLTLFSLSGERLDALPLIVEPNSFRVVDLREYAFAGTPFEEGSLQVAYRGKEMELGAQVKLVDAGRGLIFDEQLVEDSSVAFASSRLESVWWLPARACDVRLVLSNTTDAALPVGLSAGGDAPRREGAAELTLGPRETRVVDVRRELADGHRLGEVGGVTVRHAGAPGALLARAHVEEAAAGYSATVEFADPGKAKSSELHGAGLRLGRAGGQELTPVFVARNVGSARISLSGRVPYTLADGTTGVVTLPALRLSPGEARVVNTGALRRLGRAGQTVAAAGLEFEHTGAPGAVIVSAQSAGGGQVFRLPLVDPAAVPSSTGGYPWYLWGSSSTFVYIKNVTARPQAFRLQLDHAGGVYAPGLVTVAPGQTAALDIRFLRDNQVPDSKGRTIPADATRGQVLWSADGPEAGVVLVGRSEQADFARGLASSYACAHCCRDSYDGGWVEPGSMVGTVGEVTQLVAIQQNVNCYGTRLDPFQVSPAWSSSAPWVASVNSVGFVRAEGEGDATISATWPVIYWSLDSHYCRIVPEDCVGPCRRTFDDALAPAPFFARPVRFRTATLGNRTVEFENRGDPVAVFNGREVGLSFCGNALTRFTLFVNFEVHDDATALSEEHSSASGFGTTSQADYGVDGAHYDNVNLSSIPKSGRMVIRAYIRTSFPTQQPYDGIQVEVAGSYPNGSIFRGRGKVRIICQ